MSWICPYCRRPCVEGSKSVSVDGIHARLTCGRVACLRVAVHARRACRELMRTLKDMDRLKEPGPGWRMAHAAPGLYVERW